MTFQEFDAQLEQTFQEIRTLGDGKGREYANNSQANRLANFERIGKAYDIPATVVCAIYLEKHLDGIRSFVRLGKELSEEKIEGRIRDAQLYLSLLEALIIDLKVMWERKTVKPKEGKAIETEPKSKCKLAGNRKDGEAKYLCLPCGITFDSHVDAMAHLQEPIEEWKAVETKPMPQTFADALKEHLTASIEASILQGKA